MVLLIAQLLRNGTTTVTASDASKSHIPLLGQVNGDYSVATITSRARNVVLTKRLSTTDQSVAPLNIERRPLTTQGRILPLGREGEGWLGDHEGDHPSAER